MYMRWKDFKAREFDIVFLFFLDPVFENFFTENESNSVVKKPASLERLVALLFLKMNKKNF